MLYLNFENQFILEFKWIYTLSVKRFYVVNKLKINFSVTFRIIIFKIRKFIVTL